MKLASRTLQIQGMTCAGCEARIEKAIKQLEGVVEVKAHYASSTVQITYDTDNQELGVIVQAIEKLDYRVKTDLPAEADPSRKEMGWGQFAGLGIVVLALYLIVNNTIGFNFIPRADQTMGYGILLVVGLLTSVHCIAMCGGINLSVCMGYQAKDQKGKLGKLAPSALYNGGRVLSYTVMGGLIGALGGIVSFSGTAKGMVAILSGVFMILMGLNMLNIFPWLRKLNPRLPKFFGKKVYERAGNKGPLVVGLLTGFMPCGPLQAMQLYALGTGSFTAGALSMFIFSIGTLPLLFGLGAISSFLSSRFTHKMMKVSALLVMVLGLVMLSRGFNLSGYDLAFALGSSGPTGNIAKIENGIQVVTTYLDASSYAPIIIQKGIPVKWTIKADKANLNGCNNEIYSKEFGISGKRLYVGDNIVEFTPKREGEFIYTCWMGMISSKIKVVSDVTKVTSQDMTKLNNESKQFGGSGCSCCSVPQN